MATRFGAFLLLLCACAPASTRFAVVRVPEAPLSGLRQVVIRTESGEVERRLEAALRDRGFHVRRAVEVAVPGREPRAEGPERVGPPLTRYAVEGTWTVEERCAGGGFLFASFEFMVVDLRANRVVLSGGGARVFSEGCAEQGWSVPSSGARDDGTLFGDVARVLDAVWQRPPGSAPAERREVGFASL